MADAAPLFAFLDKYPVIPLTVFVTHTIALAPIIGLLYITQIAPLHNNCRYILCVWALSFGAVYAVNSALFYVDFTSGTGYMARSMYEPHLRFKLYQAHVMCTTFCSTFEIVLSAERILAIIHPGHYHFSNIAWKTLISLTISLMAFSYTVDFCVHSEEMIPRLIGCAILAVVEISVLVVGGYACRVSRLKYIRMYGHSTLTARYQAKCHSYSLLIVEYQVKEAREMAKAMIPAYVISFILKASSISALGVYYAVITKDNGYITGYVQTFMIMCYMTNGTFSIVNLLVKHPQLHRQMSRKIGSIMNLNCEEKTDIISPAADTETYFNLYSSSWK